MSPVPTVLIVDDSRFARLMIRTSITHAYPGWTIIEASNGQEALEKTAGLSVDAMTIDMNMPGMDGLTLAGHFQERYPAAHITLVTANVQESVRQRAEAAGLHFMAKPCSEQEIIACMAGVSGAQS
jgi:two-component system chemotaxis response regulator CheY